MTSTLPFQYLIGHVPFCMAEADDASSLGEGTLNPLKVEELDQLMSWIWRVKSWEVRVNGLSIGQSEFDDYLFTITNHQRVGEKSPESPVDLICGTGLEITEEFERIDQFGQQAEFQLQIEGLDSVFREPGSLDDRDGPWYPRLEVQLDLLFPLGSLPPSDPVARSTEGADLAGLLEVDGVSTQLFTGFAGQIFTGWTANIALEPVEYWDFSA